jgi:hypothetical protein
LPAVSYITIYIKAIFLDHFFSSHLHVRPERGKITTERNTNRCLQALMEFFAINQNHYYQHYTVKLWYSDFYQTFSRNKQNVGYRAQEVFLKPCIRKKVFTCLSWIRLNHVILKLSDIHIIKIYYRWIEIF